MSIARTLFGLFLMGGAVFGQPQGVLAHIAAGGDWTTVITLVNRSQLTLTSTLYLLGDDGGALSWPVTTTLRGQSQTTTPTYSVSADVESNGTGLVSVGDQVSSTVVGQAYVTTGSDKDDVGGFAIFRYSPQSGSPSEATVPLRIRSQQVSTITLPFDNIGGFVMGIALAGSSPLGDGIINVTIRDDRGNILGTQKIDLTNGFGHKAFVLPNLIPLTAAKRGILEFESSIHLNGLGLRFSPFGTFTSVPTI